MDVAADTDYPQLFRQMIVRSTEAALAALDPSALKLEEDERQRSLYALGLALDLPNAWSAAQQLLMAVSQYMEVQGDHNLWAEYLRKAIQQAEVLNDLHALGKLYVLLGLLYRFLDNYDTAQEYLLKGRQLAIDNNDRRTQLTALDKLAANAMERADFPQARQYTHDLLGLPDIDDLLRAHGCSRLGYIAMRQANWGGAVDWYTQALHLLRASHEVRFAAQAERNLGFCLLYIKRYDEATRHYQNSLQLLSQVDSPHDWAKTQMELGVAYWYLGQHQDALALYEQCEPIFVKTESQVSLAHLYNNRGLALREIGEFEKAKESFDASITLMRELGHPLWTANAMESLGGMYQRVGRVEEALATWRQALQELSALPETPQYLHDLLMRRIQEVGYSGEPNVGLP